MWLPSKNTKYENENKNGLLLTSGVFQMRSSGSARLLRSGGIEEIGFGLNRPISLPDSVLGQKSCHKLA
jgi:hypothetical protein